MRQAAAIMMTALHRPKTTGGSECPAEPCLHRPIPRRCGVGDAEDTQRGRRSIGNLEGGSSSRRGVGENEKGDGSDHRAKGPSKRGGPAFAWQGKYQREEGHSPRLRQHGQGEEPSCCTGAPVHHGVDRSGREDKRKDIIEVTKAHCQIAPGGSEREAGQQQPSSAKPAAAGIIDKGSSLHEQEDEETHESHSHTRHVEPVCCSTRKHQGGGDKQ